MIAGSLARRYARALFEIGEQKGTFEQLGKELDALAGVYDGSRELVEALSNPLFPRAQRRAVLETILGRLGASQITRNFALLVLDRERIGYLPAIAREHRAMVDEKAGRVNAEVRSARPLLDADVSAIGQVLEKATGKKVVLTSKTDPELLGGVVAKVGDVVYDGSIRTQLEMMREKFLTN